MKLSLCKSCYCSTKTIKGKCGKCGKAKQQKGWEERFDEIFCRAVGGNLQTKADESPAEDYDVLLLVKSFISTERNRLLDEVMGVVEDWFTISPKYRTKKRLLQILSKMKEE